MKPDVVNPSEPRALHRLAVAVRTSGSGLSQDWPSSSDGTRAVCISVRPPQLYEGTCRLRELREPVLWRGRSGQSAIEIQNALHIILRPAERHTDGACHGKPKPSLPRARIPGPSPLPPSSPSLSEALGRSSAALNMCRDAGIAHIPGWLRSPRAQFRGKQRAKLAPWSMDVYGSLSAMHAEETRDGLVPPAPGHGNARQVRWSSCFHRVASRARNILMFIRVSFLWHFRSPITLSWEAQSNLKI